MTPTELFVHSIAQGVSIGLVVTIGALLISLPIYLFRRASGL